MNDLNSPDFFVPSPLLKHRTTIEVGGKARYWAPVATLSQLQSALEFATIQQLSVVVLGHGSNIVADDQGFPGVIIQLMPDQHEITRVKNRIKLVADGGLSWDELCELASSHGAGGIECLSGIPGTVGAAPVQNIGAYGQDISQSIEYILAFDRTESRLVRIESGDCCFSYRQSLFKNEPKRWIIWKVGFDFDGNYKGQSQYQELTKELTRIGINPSSYTKSDLKRVRESILCIRRRKSMVIDSKDPMSRSCGSFFLNPTLSEQEFKNLTTLLADQISEPLKSYPQAQGNKYKVSAARLIELAGYRKGHRLGGAGISLNHSLAIVNYKNASSQDIRSLAEQIIARVENKFKIKLTPEPKFLERPSFSSISK